MLNMNKDNKNDYLFYIIPFIYNNTLYLYTKTAIIIYKT